MTTATRTTVHHLTNGEENWTFRITGNAALVTKTAGFGTVEVEADITTADQARNLYKNAKKYGCTVGFTRLMPKRKLTTDAQLAAHIEANYDLTSDNDPEAVLVLEEEFHFCGHVVIYG